MYAITLGVSLPSGQLDVVPPVHSWLPIAWKM
jgi:hypothetical protein